MADTPKAHKKAYFENGQSLGATHMFLIKDIMGNDYPVFIGGESATVEDLDGTPEEILALYQLDGRDVIEVFDLSQDIGTQLEQTPAWNI